MNVVSNRWISIRSVLSGCIPLGVQKYLISLSQLLTRMVKYSEIGKRKSKTVLRNKWGVHIRNLNYGLYELTQVNKYFLMWTVFAIIKIYWIYSLPALVVCNNKVVNHAVNVAPVFNTVEKCLYWLWWLKIYYNGFIINIEVSS